MNALRWLILAVMVADGVAAAVILRRDGAPEAVVWWVFLVIPLLVAAMTAVEIVRTVLRRGAR